MKIRLVIIAILCLMVTGPLAAQETDTEHKYFAKSLFISKIYPHKLGYRIIYWKAGFDYGSLYIPISWFYGAKNRAELIYGEHKSYPYMDIYWDKGQFSHIRIFVQRDINHETWGALGDPAKYDQYFNSESETLEIEW